MNEFKNDKLKTIAIVPETNLTKNKLNKDIDSLYEILEAYSSLPFDKESSSKFGRVQPISEGMYTHFVTSLHLELTSEKLFSRIHEVSKGTVTLVISYTEFISLIKHYKNSIRTSQVNLIQRLSEVSGELDYLKAFDSIPELKE